jgi:hypothetical protein
MGPVAIGISAGSTILEIVGTAALATAAVVSVNNAGKVIGRSIRNGRSVQFPCKQCLGPHGGAFGDLCQYCYFKKWGDLDNSRIWGE